MENYIGLIIAVENYHDNSKLRTVKYALNDANALKASLVSLGCKEERLEILSDNLATITTIKEKVRQLSKYTTEHETIVFYYAGHGFFYNNKNLISGVDTSLSSLDSTTIDLNFILASLEKSKSKKVIAFLDCCHSGIEFSSLERSPIITFSTDDLKNAYRNAEHITVFASCKSEEKSQVDLERNHGVWSYYLIQALEGKAKGIYDNAILFSDKLQKYLLQETTHRVKFITESKKNQTPVKFGRETTEKFVVADLTKLLEEKKAKAIEKGIRFEKVSILTYDENYVRNLPGFDKTKNHKPPKSIDSYHNNWIRKISNALVEDEINQAAELLRQKMGYKRKDIEKPIIDSGSGQLRTVDFDYVVNVTQSQKYADRFVITKSIENFRGSNILFNDKFNDAFKNTFNTLLIRLDKRLNVEDIIDGIEEIDNKDLIDVEYEQADLTQCKVNFEGFDGHIMISDVYLEIIFDKNKLPKDLILSGQKAFSFFSSQGLPKMLQ